MARVWANEEVRGGRIRAEMKGGRRLAPLACWLGLMAAAQGEPTTLERVLAGVDWTTGMEVVNPKEEAPLVVRVEFEKAGVWGKQVDVYGLRPREKGAKPAWLYGKGWGSSGGGSGSGVARPKNFRKEGFAVEFGLKWKGTAQGAGEFKEVLPCRWVAEQLFDREGFLIKVTVEKAE